MQRDEARAAAQQAEELIDQVPVESFVKIADNHGVDRAGFSQFETAKIRGCRLRCGQADTACIPVDQKPSRCGQRREQRLRAQR